MNIMTRFLFNNLLTLETLTFPAVIYKFIAFFLNPLNFNKNIPRDFRKPFSHYSFSDAHFFVPSAVLSFLELTNLAMP